MSQEKVSVVVLGKEFDLDVPEGSQVQTDAMTSETAIDQNRPLDEQVKELLARALFGNVNG